MHRKCTEVIKDDRDSIHSPVAQTGGRSSGRPLFVGRKSSPNPAPLDRAVGPLEFRDDGILGLAAQADMDRALGAPEARGMKA